MPLLLKITFAILVSALIVVLGAAIAVAIHWNINRVPSPPDPLEFRPVLTREEFRSSVFQENPLKVVAVVGRPDRTRSIGHHELWYYEGRVRDTTSGRMGNARLRMALGQVCDEVDFD